MEALIISLGILAIAGVIVLTIRQSMRSWALETTSHIAAMREREACAVWAGATVVSIISDPHQHAEHGSATMELLLQIQPPQGAPYTTRTRWNVDLSARPLIQPGAQLPIKIDAHEPKIVYPNISGAAFSPF
ncbi:hypothetical protein F8S13_02750 [Chloroflexia bacterium SDU3-3]|nr:hypothetical protein F8S13_02750 [Chloroflexia bacterium SDU3-3]